MPFNQHIFQLMIRIVTIAQDYFEGCCLVAMSCLTLHNPRIVSCQASLSMGCPRQEYWIVLPFPSPGDLTDPGVEPEFAALAGRFFTTEPPEKPYHILDIIQSIGMP